MQIPFSVQRQYFLPQQPLSWFAGKLAHCRIPWFKRWAIQRFVRLYQVNVEEALDADLNSYASFHDFFIRRLKPELRPIAPGANTICSPCDGTISQIGKIEDNQIVQAKGRQYTTQALLGNQTLSDLFTNGHFATIYLAPQNYHRVHMPTAGILQQLRYIPGKLFSVNPLTTQHVNQLFARNERLVTLYQSPKGTFAMILVGAMLVGSIFTRWSGHLTPHRGKKMIHVEYSNAPEQHIALDKGEEMGYFSLGSTVILLFSEGLCWNESLSHNTQVVVGQEIGQFLT